MCQRGSAVSDKQVLQYVEVMAQAAEEEKVGFSNQSCRLLGCLIMAPGRELRTSRTVAGTGKAGLGMLWEFHLEVLRAIQVSLVARDAE